MDKLADRYVLAEGWRRMEGGFSMRKLMDTPDIWWINKDFKEGHPIEYRLVLECVK